MNARRDMRTADADWRGTGKTLDAYAAAGRAYKPPIKHRAPKAWAVIDLGFLALGLCIGVLTTAASLGAI